MTSLEHEVHMAFMENYQSLEKSLKQVVDENDIEGRRKGFQILSNALEATLKRFTIDADQPLYRFVCPMAFGGRGASWLQFSREVNNPYFGKAMPGCGELEQTISGPDEK